jgi:hypothetical protein
MWIMVYIETVVLIFPSIFFFIFLLDIFHCSIQSFYKLAQMSCYVKHDYTTS